MASLEVLLIDDDAYASMLRKRVLETKGYRVQLALDGTTGIALADVLRPAMVIFDHRLPGMSGPELFHLLRKLLPSTPLVSLSGQDNLSTHYDPQPDAYLTKGDPIPLMLQTIAALLP